MLALTASAAMTLGVTALPIGPGIRADAAGTTPAYRNVMYYGDWSIYAGQHNYYPSDVDAKELTHLNFAFMDCDANGNLILCDEHADFLATLPEQAGLTYGDPYAGVFGGMRILRDKNPNLKIGVSVGGWTRSGDFSAMAANATSRKNFAGNIARFIDYLGFDFVDIDWEYPCENRASDPEGNGVTIDEGCKGTPDLVQPPTEPETPVTPVAGKLPAHMVVGYWHNFCNGSANLKLSDVPDCYDMINVAFTGNSSTPGEATFAIDKDLSDALGGYSDEEFKKDIRAIQEQGRFVLISVGGAEGRISINSDAAAETFADSMIKIIEKYGFNGVDIDLEGGAVSGTAYIASALRKLHDHFGQDFIITMAPETAYVQNAQGSYLKLALQIKDILTICYPQFYNSGSMIGYDGEIVQPGTADFIDGQLTTIVESGLDASQVGIGLPSIPKAAGSGYISSDVIERAVRAFVTGGRADRFIVPKAYSGLRAMMCWSINWDATNGYAWGKAMSDLMDEVPSMKAAPADTTITGSATDWNSSSTYNTGDIVCYNGIYYRCKWWNQNNAPTTGQTSPWERAA